MSNAEEKTALELEKIFWLITEDKYAKLRKINGCADLADLPATVPDSKHVLDMADNLGIPEKNRYIDTSPTVKSLKKSYLAIIKYTRQLTAAGVPHVIFCYVGGHGASQAER